MTSPAPFPELLAYAMAQPCPTCHARPGDPCDAPRKLAKVARINRVRARYGMKPTRHDLIRLLHSPRIDLGIRQHGRDIGNAPWPDEREPGKRYDTLGLCEFQLALIRWRLEQLANRLDTKREAS